MAMAIDFMGLNRRSVFAESKALLQTKRMPLSAALDDIGENRHVAEIPSQPVAGSYLHSRNGIPPEKFRVQACWNSVSKKFTPRGS
jgi:hypothetical protein